MDESILESIKKLLGLPASYTNFDQDIVIHINTYLGVLNQMGVGKEGFYIEDDDAVWETFLMDIQLAFMRLRHMCISV